MMMNQLIFFGPHGSPILNQRGRETETIVLMEILRCLRADHTRGDETIGGYHEHQKIPWVLIILAMWSLWDD